MAAGFFGGLFQTVAGGIATAATLGLNQDVLDWTVDGACKVGNNADKAWGKDGEITQFVEGMPVLGYVASAGHGIAAAATGNEEDLQRARRACASSTKSTLTTAGALAAGPGGAVLANAAGQCAEKGINHANDKKFQTGGGTFNDFSVGSFAGEMAMTGVMGKMPSVGGKAGSAAARGFVGESLKEAGGGGAKRYIQKRAVEIAVKKPVNAIVNKGVEATFYPRK